MDPDEWLCAAFSIRGIEKAFKVIQIGPKDPDGVIVRVLHNETGAVWTFKCKIERGGVT